jgi:hypothetical protein
MQPAATIRGALDFWAQDWFADALAPDIHRAITAGPVEPHLHQVRFSADGIKQLLRRGPAGLLVFPVPTLAAGGADGMSPPEAAKMMELLGEPESMLPNMLAQAGGCAGCAEERPSTVAARRMH